MKYLYFIIPLAFLLLILLTILLLHFRKKRVIKKVRSLSTEEKNTLINRLIEPVGYIYDPSQDIFATRLNAPQKLFGYTIFYDLSAPYFNMVFDYETIYFDYGGRTWLIEMWKGQYGINSGCELGIYYADSIVPPDKYDTTLFHAVDEADMLDISLKLNKSAAKPNTTPSRLGYLHYHHWWLTIFKMGVFSKPKQLFVNTSIRFKTYTMMYSFLESFDKVLPETPYVLNGLNVYFTFCKSYRKHNWLKKMVRHIALISCHLYCTLFNFITRPFQNTGDKILYIYYYLPFAIRLIFKPKKKKMVCLRTKK